MNTQLVESLVQVILTLSAVERTLLEEKLLEILHSSIRELVQLTSKQ